LNVLLFLCSYSQENCPFESVYEDMIAFPAFVSNMEEYEEGFVDFMFDPNYGGNYDLPVVVHVLHQTGYPILSDEQIIRSLELVNEQYLASGINITFYLAGIDEEGGCTDGINRFNIGSLELDTSDPSWKDQYEWNRYKYINVFVSHMFDTASSVGWGTPPFLIEDGDPGDGVVIRSAELGDIELANNNTYPSALAHELGHYLGLYHVDHKTAIAMGGTACFDCVGFHDPDNPGDQTQPNSALGWRRGDRINDTDPVRFGFGYGDCDNPRVDQCFDFVLPVCGEAENFVYPVENYMSSQSNECHIGFVEEQGLRMYYSLEQYRTNLWQQNLSASCLWESDDQYITGVSTWPSGNHVVNRNLIIKSGSSLTIEPNTTLSFCKDKGITVQPGATLDLQGTLTSCEGQWKGIEVWGTDNANISFPTSGNGKLITQIGSVIENASTGIFLGGPIIGGNYTNTG